MWSQSRGGRATNLRDKQWYTNTIGNIISLRTKCKNNLNIYQLLNGYLIWRNTISKMSSSLVHATWIHLKACELKPDVENYVSWRSSCVKCPKRQESVNGSLGSRGGRNKELHNKGQKESREAGGVLKLTDGEGSIISWSSWGETAVTSVLERSELTSFENPQERFTARRAQTTQCN